MVVRLQTKRTLKKAVEKRAATGKCLIGLEFEGEPDAEEKGLCNSPAKCRGLCSRHYQQYRLQWLQKTPEERAAFESEQVHEGRLLPTRQGQRLDVDNPFREKAS